MNTELELLVSPEGVLDPAGKNVPALADVAPVNKRLSKTHAAALETCILRLHALCDQFNPACGVSVDNKEAVKCYVESWILPQLQDILWPPQDYEYDTTKVAAMDVYGQRRWAQEAEENRKNSVA